MFAALACARAEPQAKMLTVRAQVRALAFSPDARMLACAEVDADDNTIALRRASDGAVVARTHPDKDLLWSVAWSPDGAQVASVGVGHTVRLWRASDLAPLASWPVPTDRQDALAVAFSADGQMVTVSGVKQIWTWRSGDRHLESVRSVSVGDDYVGLCPLTLSPDAATIAACQRSGAIDLRRGPDNRVIRTLPGHSGGTWRLAFSRDGALLFSGGTDGREGTGELDIPLSGVRVCRISDGKLLAKLPVGQGLALALTVSRDGRWLAAGAGDTIALWPVTWN